MHRDQVYELCKTAAPAHGFLPLFFLSLCEQESVNPKDPLDYRHGAVRLENGYEHKYTDPLNFAETTEILLATSYGLTQMMGLSLYETGFFDWWFTQQTEDVRKFLGEPMSEIAVPKALNQYLVNPAWHVERGAQYLAVKQKAANGDTIRMLRLWNGDLDGTKHYAEQILARFEKLKGIYKVTDDKP